MQEKRKHISQMSYKEQEALVNLVNNTIFSFCDYCLYKMKRRKIKRKQVVKAIKNGYLIEYHFKDNSHRVLLRSRPNNNRKCVCVVLDLTKRTIVTTYYNHCNDRHATLNLSFYDKNLDVLQMLNSKKGESSSDTNYFRDCF